MEETTISTPTEVADVDTSSTLEPTDVDTSSEEPTSDNVAETETETTQEEPKLYAGKYKSVEELEKGYQESQKAFNEKAELQKRYDALIAEQQAKEEKAQREALNQAQKRGFDSVEAQQIADKVQVAELEAYANSLDTVNPQYYEEARQALANYYSTGNRGYLEQAKQFFNTNTIEKVALEMNALENRLKGEVDIRNRQQFEQNEQKLANELRTNFGEFLTSIKDNAPVAQALQMFCNTGHIQSSEDMQVFVDIVGKMQNFYKEQAIKEYEAQKTIDETKNKAVIETAQNVDTQNKSKYTMKDVGNMTQKEFDAYCKKHGTDWIYT